MSILTLILLYQQTLGLWFPVKATSLQVFYLKTNNMQLILLISSLPLWLKLFSQTLVTTVCRTFVI